MPSDGHFILCPEPTQFFWLFLKHYFMKRFLKKLSSIKISELIVVTIFLPFVILSLTNRVKLELVISPSENPAIKTITVHPNPRALSIGGQMGYANQLMWLEDQEQKEIIKLYTDENSNFIAALDSSSRLTRVGSHRVVALIEIVQDKTILLESEVLRYTIDNEFNVTLDPASRRTIAFRIQNITDDELKALQSKHQLSILSLDRNQEIKSQWTSIKEMFFWFAVYNWTIYAILLLFVPYLIVKRWRRKKAEHQSFWSLGRGIYFKHGHT